MLSEEEGISDRFSRGSAGIESGSEEERDGSIGVEIEFISAEPSVTTEAGGVEAMEGSWGRLPVLGISTALEEPRRVGLDRGVGLGLGPPNGGAGEEVGLVNPLVVVDDGADIFFPDPS